MAENRPAAWWSALQAQGLDGLSAPELALAVQELAQDQHAFVGLLAAANDYPRVPLCSVRRPEPAEIERLDSQLPRCRAVLLPEDDLGLQTARGVFDVLLVLDPLWRTGDLLYASWHAREGIPPEYARRLHAHLAPAVRLSEAREAIHFIPDHLPGSWDPFPVPTSGPLRRAAGLLYWSNRLRAVAVAGQPEVASCLRDLAQAGPDLQGTGGAELRIEAEPCPHDDWPVIFDTLAEDPTPLVPLLGSAQPEAAWRLGLGAPSLPDVSLALLRAQSGRPIRSGLPGTPFPLARRPIYLVRR
jgi:hypothetical protein